MQNSPIGVFDSGAGGLSVLKELIRELPNESFYYFADTANCPYGSKPSDTIIGLSERITRFLLAKGCKAIVVACNTATAAAIEHLRNRFSVPFIGMEPAIKPASLNSKTGSIGVLATAGTFKGRLYRETSKKYAAHVTVCYQIGEGLVELVEEGKSTSPQAVKLLKQYINPMLRCNIDHLVLGCTHYPFLLSSIQKIIPRTVTVIEPAHAVAKQTKRILTKHNLLTASARPEVRIYSSASLNTIEQLINKHPIIPSNIPLKYCHNHNDSIQQA